jgi:hypothetical protein
LPELVSQGCDVVVVSQVQNHNLSGLCRRFTSASVKSGEFVCYCHKFASIVTIIYAAVAGGAKLKTQCLDGSSAVMGFYFFALFAELDAQSFALA